MIATLLRTASFSALASIAALAQGTSSYFNVESPQRKPIAVARVAGHDYLVACNTPDNSIEIYDTHTLTFLARVQTGAEPISVVPNANLGKLFVCNFLGDSISIVALSAPGPDGPLTATLERTVVVGDEPNHLAFAPGDASLYVALGSQSAYGHLSTSDLSPVAPGAERIFLTDETGTKAIKDPCSLLVSGGRLLALGHHGGKSLPLPAEFGAGYDFDLWIEDLSSPASPVAEVNGLGTIHYGMAQSLGGELWVVGTDARIDLVGQTAVRTAPFGFVRSMLYRVSGAGGASPLVQARDLNQDENGAQVAAAQALSQPTDVVVYEPAAVFVVPTVPGMQIPLPLGVRSRKKVYVAAFHSDRVGVVVPGGAPAQWRIGRIPLPTAPGLPDRMLGPRGLALKYRSSLAGDPGDRLYVFDRLSNAVSVIDPATDAVTDTFVLQRDPTPAHIRAGEEFLYGAHHSGSGIVACASCHVDGRSDWLRWNLSDDSVVVPFPPNFLDGAQGASPGSSTVYFPERKDFMVTRSLQGLVNYETQPEAQAYFSNEPLHWRGDRATFLDFNQAFVDVLDRPSALSAAEMDAFRRFAFSIAYPPNPEQPATRTYSGDFGTPDDEQDGSGAQRGMKLFHTRASLPGNSADACYGRSCVQCHFLPEGSNDRATLFSVNLEPDGERQPIESAPLRFVRQRERMIETSGAVLGTVRTGLFGLGHEGTAPSTRAFVDVGFDGDLAPDERADVAQFVREFDVGVGPMVGRSHSVDLANKNLPETDSLFQLLESQAGLANHGLAVQARLGGAARGFWYDLARQPPAYREDADGSLRTRSDLLGLVVGASDLLVLHATPLGSERRFAWPSAGAPPPLPGPAPSAIALEPMGTGTAYRDVPRLVKNWIPVSEQGDFEWFGLPIRTPPSLKIVRQMQYGLAQDGPQFGLPGPRHEAPRRFRVSMDDGRHGARLVLRTGVSPGIPPPNSTHFLELDLPLHPTDQVNVDGRRIWETAVELDARTLYVLMLGGPAAPGVDRTLDGEVADEPPPVGTYQPGVWNSHLVEVRNENGAARSGGWQAIRIQ